MGGKYKNIAEDAAILGTLYNRGHKTTKPHSSPKSNPFGDYVAEKYDYMKDLLGIKE